MRERPQQFETEQGGQFGCTAHDSRSGGLCCSPARMRLNWGAGPPTVIRPDGLAHGRPARADHKQVEAGPVDPGAELDGIAGTRLSDQFVDRLDVGAGRERQSRQVGRSIKLSGWSAPRADPGSSMPPELRCPDHGRSQRCSTSKQTSWPGFISFASSEGNCIGKKLHQP